MGETKRARVDKLDLDAIVSKPTKGQAISELDRQIRGLQYKLSDKVRDAFATQKLHITDVSMRFGLSYSGMSQVLRNAFTMKIDLIGSFIRLLFPGKTVDEVVFGISRPTRIPLLSNLFVNLYDEIPSDKKRTLRVELKKIAVATDFNRKERVDAIYESNGNHRRCYDEVFSKLTTMKSIMSSLKFCTASAEDLATFRTLTYMRFAVLSNYSMDYFSVVDYTNCNLTMLTPELERQTIPESKKFMLRYFTMIPSKQAQMDMIADMLASAALAEP